MSRAAVAEDIAAITDWHGIPDALRGIG
jgi:hypothetical protein